jgi:hypothetical protein
MGRLTNLLRRPIVERSLLVLGGLLAGLLLLEVGLRIGLGDRLTNVHGISKDRVTDPGIPGVPYVYRAGQRDFTNNLGLRMARDVEPVKTPGSLRVLLLTDSAGEVVEADAGTDALFPCRLEGLLSASLGQRVEVLNLAVPGLSFEQERRLMEVRRREWGADAAIFAYNYNDPIETDVRDLPNIPVLRWFELADAVLLARYELRKDQESWYAPGSEVYRDLEASFAALGRTAAEFPVFFVPLPLILPATQPQPHIPAVTELCRRNGIPVIDIYTALRDDLPAFMLPGSSNDWNHYNARGHAAIAAALAIALQEHLR